MPVTIEIHFKGVGSKVDAPKNKPVVWKLSKQGLPGQPGVEKGNATTNTTADGVLIIPNIDMAETEALRLDYTIGTQTSFIVVRHTDESKAGGPLKIQHYLSLRVEIAIQ